MHGHQHTITIDPITRIEGHLKVECVLDDGVVKEARTGGTLFRGFEKIMVGHHPTDAPILTQRVCGVCPIAHATASALALDDAFGIADRIPDNGRIIRNLILGANILQSHILHFYHLAALDFVDVTAVANYRGDDAALQSIRDFIGRGELAPFVPRYEGDYRLSAKQNREATQHYALALNMRRRSHELLAVFGGKMPHQCAIVAGGVTSVPTSDTIGAFLSMLNEVRQFIDSQYVSDVLMVAKAYPDYFEIGAGPGRWLAYGGLDLETKPADLLKRKRFFASGRANGGLQATDVDQARIAEHVRHAWFADETSNKHPSQGETEPEPGKAGGYSWIKAPRYDGAPHEVGPLARTAVAYARGNRGIKGEVNRLLRRFDAEAGALNSTLGRHAARALETKRVADAMADWAMQLKPGEPVAAPFTVPDEGAGMGLTDAPRGALGHWIEIEGGHIARYQLVVPTTWNASPHDDADTPGPMEQALIGTPIRDAENPFEIVRIVRSFDPCLACSIHLATPKGDRITECRVV